MSPDPDARPTLAADALDVLFRKARTHRAWLDRPVPDDLLRRVYELAAEGPTSANCSPMRVLFARSREAKERLRPALTPEPLRSLTGRQPGARPAACPAHRTAPGAAPGQLT